MMDMVDHRETYRRMRQAAKKGRGRQTAEKITGLVAGGHDTVTACLMYSAWVNEQRRADDDPFPCGFKDLE